MLHSIRPLSHEKGPKMSANMIMDDAYYRLAKLFETKLNQSQKAKEYYELIIFNYENSIYFVEARKKFRLLRGDEIK